MPYEREPHARTWIAFVPREELWGAQLHPRVREDLARVANALARFEPVKKSVSSTHRETGTSGLQSDCTARTAPSFARRLRALGVPHEARQDLPGHANRNITTEYSAADLGELLDVVADRKLTRFWGEFQLKIDQGV